MDTVIRFKNVNKMFVNKQILKNISFEVKRKDVLGLVGPNGAGKTTLTRLILGSLKPSSGNVEVFGEDNNKEIREGNKNIGFVLERHGFDENETAEHNIYFYCDLYNINKGEANARIDKMKSVLGLELNMRDYVGTYSKGMLQQLAILRSLIHKPRLLVLDEPTNGLDPNMQSLIQKLIINLSDKYDVTIIVSSHNLGELENICNKFMLINRGEIKSFIDKKDIRYKNNYKVIFSIDNINMSDNIFNFLSENRNILGYKILKDKIIIDISDHQYATTLYNQLIENGYSVGNMQIREIDIEDYYFKIIGEERYDYETGIY